MQKQKNDHTSLTNNQTLIAVAVLIVLAVTGALGGLIELVIGLTFGMFGLVVGLIGGAIGLVLGLVFGIIGLVFGLLPIIIPVAIVVAIFKNMNRNEAKRKNDYI